MKKAQWALLAVTAGFLCVLMGMFVGRNTKGSYDWLPEFPQQIESAETTAPTSPAEKGKLNINTATAQELTMLPGIGEVLAQRIVDYRNEHGAFTSIDELLNVKDIGPVRLEKITDYITIGE